jgi:hypothetical protein
MLRFGRECESRLIARASETASAAESGSRSESGSAWALA